MKPVNDRIFIRVFEIPKDHESCTNCSCRCRDIQERLNDVQKLEFHLRGMRVRGKERSKSTSNKRKDKES